MAFLRFLQRLFKVLFLVALVAIGWIAGDRYGMPDAVRERVYALLGDARTAGEDGLKVSRDYFEARLEEARKFDFDFDLPSLPENIRPEDLRIGTREVEDAADVDDSASVDEPAIVADAADATGPSSPPVVTTPPAARAAGTLTVLNLCPRMAVSNAPRANAEGEVVGLAQKISVNGVAVRTTPVTEGCLSSGYGPRSGKLHKGVDFHHPTGSQILAAADGTILEAQYRDDYGNYLVIDHGDGVYTRYAHLKSFAGGVKSGARVFDGQKLGAMGNTAGWSMPIHLHYELLTGNYDTPKKAFGLTPRNPLTGRG